MQSKKLYVETPVGGEYPPRETKLSSQRQSARI